MLPSIKSIDATKLIAIIKLKNNFYNKMKYTIYSFIICPCDDICTQISK